MTEALTPARLWLSEESGRAFIWRHLGSLELPEKKIFIGDPTSGDESLFDNIAPLECSRLNIWIYESGDENDDFYAHTNGLIWLEADGSKPINKGLALEFGVDAACLGIGSAEAAQALIALGNDDHSRDALDWLTPFIVEESHFARMVAIPPEDSALLLASTGRDGSYKAVWLYSRQNELSGILVDIAGRASDCLFLDMLLPAKNPE